MSLFGEFYVPAGSFALEYTLGELPETVIEIERIVATDEVITPYFWVTTDDLETFESAVDADPSIDDLRRLDTFDRATLYRADWTDNTDAVVYAYTQVGAPILEASSQDDEWRIEMRFDDHERLEQFTRYCTEADIPFRLTKLHEIAKPHTANAQGLTNRQYEALVTAHEVGYFTSSTVTLAEVADELDITTQSLSELLHRGYDTLIANTLVVTGPHAAAGDADSHTTRQ